MKKKFELDKVNDVRVRFFPAEFITSSMTTAFAVSVIPSVDRKNLAISLGRASNSVDRGDVSESRKGPI